MSSSLIRGKYVVTQAGVSQDSSAVISDGAIFQQDGAIVEVGPYQTLRAKYQPDVELGGPRYAVIPGFVNAHHHGRGVTTLQMGTCDDSLETWILMGWGRRPYDHYLMTLYTALQMVESGTTTVMYNHPQTPVATLEQDISDVLRGFSDAGMRVAYSMYFRNQNRVVYTGDESFLAGLSADLAGSVRDYLAVTDMTDDEYFGLFERLYAKHAAEGSGKIRTLLSPSNVQWNSDDFLQRTKEYAQRYQTGIHMHLVESCYQKDYGIRTWGKTPVEHLHELEFLGPELSCAHSVWLTEGDIELLAASGATVCHNASSNLRLKNGIAPVNALLAAGVNVAMGTDSTAVNDDDDMVQEMRLVSKLHRQPGIGAPSITTHQTLKMATGNGAAPTFFGGEIGVLEAGRRADLSLVRLDGVEEPYLDGEISPVDALLYRAKAGDIETVMVDGEVTLQDGVHAKVDKAEVMAELRERFSRPLEPEARATRQMVRRLLPYAERFYASRPPGMGAPFYQFNSRT